MERASADSDLFSRLADRMESRFAERQGSYPGHAVGAGPLPLKGGRFLSLAFLTEAFFDIPGVLDFSAEVVGLGERDQLHICFRATEGEEERVARKALSALLHDPAAAPLLREKVLGLGSITFSRTGWPGARVAAFGRQSGTSTEDRA